MALESPAARAMAGGTVHLAGSARGTGRRGDAHLHAAAIASRCGRNSSVNSAAPAALPLLLDLGGGSIAELDHLGGSENSGAGGRLVVHDAPDAARAVERTG